MQLQISRTLVALMTGGVLLAGCQSYERKPLDMAATRSAWLDRLPSDESVRQFADRLSQTEPRVDADIFDPSDGLTLAEAEPVALVFNRDLRLARLQANVTRATADHAGLWADPSLGINGARIISGVPDPWVIGGTIGLTIPISGRLEVEKARAGADHEATLHRLAATEWATRTALRELWIQWSAQTTRAELTTQQVERLRSVAELAQRQERAGALSRIEERLFRVELAISESQVIDAQAKAGELELQLRDLLGLSPEAPVQFVRTIAFTPRGSDPHWLRDSMESENLELAAVRSEYEVAEETLRLEIRKQYPDLTIGPGFGADEGDERFLLGLQLPLPLWNRNQQGIAQAEAGREVARGRFESAYERLSSSLAIARSRYEAGQAMRLIVEEHVLPLADEQDADVRKAAQLGRVEPLLLLQSLKSQYDAKVRLIDARAAEAIGAIRLDELIGPPPPESPEPSIPDDTSNPPQISTTGGNP